MNPTFLKFLSVIAAATMVSTLSACNSPKPLPPSAASPASPGNVIAAAPSPPSARPAIDVAKYRPNEVGLIPVLMYHAIGAAAYNGTRYDRNGLNIAPETFRRHLKLMYEAGWYPVNMRDVLTPHLDVPAGKIPVVLTFDDARGTQLHYQADGTMDPDCAVAIMEAFHAEHPDWPLRGSFYLLPKSKWNPVPFYQQGTEKRKLQYLEQQGYELANHSTSHERMDRMSAARLAWEMAECVRYVHERVPNASMDTMALPMGYVPRSMALLDVLLAGKDKNTTFHNLCILRAWGGPTYAFTDKRYSPYKVTRIGVSPGYLEGYVRRMKRGTEDAPFISDGDPGTVTVPKSREKYLDRNRLQGAQVLVYDDLPKKPAKKPGTKGSPGTGRSKQTK